jgi:hypothetical protein
MRLGRSGKRFRLGLTVGTATLLTLLFAFAVQAADNNPPVANPDTLRPSQAVNVLANDSDPDSDPLTLIAYTQPGPTGGSITCSSDGSCTWTQPADICTNPPSSSDLTASYTVSRTDVAGPRWGRSTCDRSSCAWE